MLPAVPLRLGPPTGKYFGVVVEQPEHGFELRQRRAAAYLAGRFVPSDVAFGHQFREVNVSQLCLDAPPVDAPHGGEFLAHRPLLARTLPDEGE